MYSTVRGVGVAFLANAGERFDAFRTAVTEVFIFDVGLATGAFNI